MHHRLGRSLAAVHKKRVVATACRQKPTARVAVFESNGDRNPEKIREGRIFWLFGGN